MKLRPYEAGDQDELVRLWHRSKRHAYPYLATEQAYTLETDTAFFRDHIEGRCELHVATGEGEILGFLALEGDYLDRLYVRPDCQRGGVGSALLELARSLRPDGLELHTHQQNVSACAFYEKHGFAPVSWGSSSPPESAPDVRYRWRP